ncbi:MAG: alpha-amylase [Lachnospiraceae bacterium]|nr:alpha-amylase [Lachnospiraceae bacterium]
MLNKEKKMYRLLCLLLVVILVAGCTGNGTVENGTDSDVSAEAESGTGISADEEEQNETTHVKLTELEEEEKALVPVEVPMEDNYRTYYEVFVYSFFDGNGDGIGDLQGLTDKLDYINDGNPMTTTDLGCNGIWLMPIMPSPSYHKYDITDYYEIDPEYGTMDDFENLIEECDKRGIKVIIDLVINHSSSEHPWFQEACTYLAELGDGEPSLDECPYVDYYHFSKEAKNGYSQVPGSDVWYYEAQFFYGMPDLNLYNEQLRSEIEGIVDFWLSKGVGGFRLDAAKEYETGADSANVEILTWFTDMVKEKKEDAYLVAEVWTDISTYAQYYDSGIDSVFDFSFADSDGIIANVVKASTPASAYGKSLENVQTIFAEHNPDYIDAPFYTNHDLGRSAGYYSGDYSEAQTKIAGALNLLMTGNAFVYYGEELGMKGAGKDENKRAPMYFSDDKDMAGMCNGPADMDSVKMKYGSLEEQQPNPYSIYNYYKKAIRIRNAFPAIMKGSVTNLENYSDDTLTVFTKTYEDEVICIFCNISTEPRTVQISEDIFETEEIAAGLYVDENKAMMEGNELTIPGYGIVIFSK